MTWGVKRTAALIAVSGVALPVGWATLAATSVSAANGETGSCVQRFLSKADVPLWQYRALRHLQARTDRFEKSAWLEAWTELDPVKGFQYEIVAEGGSDSIRDRVLKVALKGEQKAWATGEAERSDVTPANYAFESAGQESGLLKLVLKPRRKDSFLLTGVAYLSPDDVEIVRIEGSLVKTPSFWTRRVDVIKRYERVAGVMVPISLESIAQVRMIGPSNFVMTYEYESVNGQPVGGNLTAKTR
jgi:hypothetical protein